MHATCFHSLAESTQPLGVTRVALLYPPSEVGPFQSFIRQWPRCRLSCLVRASWRAAASRKRASGRGLNFNFRASAKLTLTSAANFEETSECPYRVSYFQCADGFLSKFLRKNSTLLKQGDILFNNPICSCICICSYALPCAYSAVWRR